MNDMARVLSMGVENAKAGVEGAGETGSASAGACGR